MNWSLRALIRKEKILLSVGLFFLVIIFIANEWVIARTISGDGVLSPLSKIVVRVFDGVLIIISTSIIIFRTSLARLLDRKKVLGLAIGLVIAIIVAEGISFVALRYWFKVGPIAREGVISDQGLFIFTNKSPVLPFGIKNNFNQELNTSQFRTTIRTNNVGMREDIDYDGKPADISFLGDSFTFGWGVNVGERYSDLLRGYFPRKRILSYGFLNGWAPPHYYLFLKYYPEYIPKDIAVLGFYPFNDMDLDMRDTEFIFDKNDELIRTKTTIRYVTDTGALGVKQVYDTAGVVGIKKILNYSYSGKLILLTWANRVDSFNKKTKVGEEKWNVRQQIGDERASFRAGVFDGNDLKSLEYIAKLRDLLTRRGTRLIVFLIPYFKHVSGGEYPQWNPIVQWLQDNEIEFIDPLDVFVAQEKADQTVYIIGDGHWTKAGHQVAAKLIHEYLEEHP